MSENAHDTNKYKDYRKWEKKAPEISSLSFEEALKELEALSQRLSQGGLPLEESVEAYARGSELPNTAMTC